MFLFFCFFGSASSSGEQFKLSHVPNIHSFSLLTGMPSKSFLGGSAVKNLPANAVDMDLIPRSGRFPGEGNGYPFQYSCLENSMDRGA